MTAGGDHTGDGRRRGVRGGVASPVASPRALPVPGSRADRGLPCGGRGSKTCPRCLRDSAPHSLGPLPNRRASPLESYCGGPRFLRDPCPPIPRRHADDRPSATMPSQSSPGLAMRNVVHLRPARTGAGAGATWSPSPVLRPDTRHGRRT